MHAITWRIWFRLFILFSCLSESQGARSSENNQGAVAAGSDSDSDAESGEHPLSYYLRPNPDADYRRIYMLERGDTPHVWLHRAFVQRRMPEAEDYPFSELVRERNPDEVDVVPDRTDETGRTFLVTLFNLYTNPTPGFSTVMAEGPFRVQPLLESDEILLATEPGVHWNTRWYYRFLRRHPQTFSVVPRGQGCFHVPEDKDGRQWLLDPDERRPVSEILLSGEDWLIDAYPDPQMPPAFLFRIIRAEDPRTALRRLGPNQFMVNGPWRVLPNYADDRLERFAPVEPGWPNWRDDSTVFRSIWRQGPIAEQFPGYYFYSFKTIISRKRQAEREAEERFRAFYRKEYGRTAGPSQFHVNRYENRCMKSDILHYILPPTGTAQEHFTIDGIVTSSSPDDDYKNNLPNYRLDDGPTAVPERLEARLIGPGIDRVIAQTRHTDNLPFYFEEPKTRFSLSTVLASLVFCVFSGGSKSEVTASK